ncbi:cysteine-rich tail protein 1 [Nycticebus coucang]|uniref:cysteine-rich tail protein 1 n=1 Tax=Nycticebus coucang TaxID=9470 RepID=UPI00234D43F2|nr:cysteine-rich tail protein 1 [Nycticebus coucang]XP_053412871.1 cysteine-rich tail protein 1 [Nycticebus coucang]
MAPPLPRREKVLAVSQLTGTGTWNLDGQEDRLPYNHTTTTGWAMDPHEMLVKNPYAHISIPRAHLRPELGQQLEAVPSPTSSSLETQPVPMGPCTLEPAHLLQPTEVPGSKGTKGAVSTQSQQAWQQSCKHSGSGQRPLGLTYAGLPPVGQGDDIAHHCCCCPCCRCCHCPRFCRCHSRCCVVS